tara:strand:+ start:9109 stop:10158 length:1050 start_codon:yes stop_codon:yes gene_type:complete
MKHPDRIANEQRRATLSKLFAPLTSNIDRNTIRPAPFALKAYPSDAQRSALIDQALELGGPPGTVIAREIPEDTAGCSVEVLCGWERVEAYLHRDAFPRATMVPMAVISASDADAAYYAIEYAQEHHKACGYECSPLNYALAAQEAIRHFNEATSAWNIQELANALCIARPTLSNRIRLLKGLQPGVQAMLGTGRLKPEFAKILLAEKAPRRQLQLAERAASGKLRTRELYSLVHPDYVPPRSSKQPRKKSKVQLGDTSIMERTLEETYGSPSKILVGNQAETAGCIELSFYSLSELKGILEKLDANAQTDSLFQGELSFKASTPNRTNELLDEMGAIDEPIRKSGAPE